MVCSQEDGDIHLANAVAFVNQGMIRTAYYNLHWKGDYFVLFLQSTFRTQSVYKKRETACWLGYNVCNILLDGSSKLRVLVSFTRLGKCARRHPEMTVSSNSFIMILSQNILHIIVNSSKKC